jgi:hypothetical protein
MAQALIDLTAGSRVQQYHLGIPPNLSDGLIAYWKFDETSGTRSDATGNGNQLVEVSGSVPYEVGKIGNAAYINNGIPTGWLETTNPNFYIGTGARTYSTWMGWGVNNVGYQWGIMSKESDDYSGPILFYLEQNNTITSRFSTSGDTWDQSFTSDITPETGTYYHLAITITGTLVDTPMLTFYVNGSVYDSQTYSQPLLGSGNLTFGEYDPFSFSYNGVFDETGVWNRKLSDLEILSLYNSGAGRTYPF